MTEPILDIEITDERAQELRGRVTRENIREAQKFLIEAGLFLPDRPGSIFLNIVVAERTGRFLFIEGAQNGRAAAAGKPPVKEVVVDFQRDVPEALRISYYETIRTMDSGERFDRMADTMRSNKHFAIARQIAEALKRQSVDFQAEDACQRGLRALSRLWMQTDRSYLRHIAHPR